MQQDKRIKRILRQVKSKVFSLTSALSAAPSCTLSSNKLKKPITFKSKSLINESGIPSSSMIRKESVDASPLLSDLSSAVYLGFKNEVLSKLYTKEDNVVIPSLTTLSSFAVGDNSPIQDVSANTDNILYEELFYECIPFQYKRLVLFQHIIQLHVKHIQLPQVFMKMIDYCHDAHAYYQVFCLLKGFWNNIGMTRKPQLQWSFDLCRNICKTDAWIKYICHHLSPKDVFHSELTEFVSSKSTLLTDSQIQSVYVALLHFLVDYRRDFPSDPIAQDSTITILSFFITQQHDSCNDSIVLMDLIDLVYMHILKWIEQANLSILDSLKIMFRKYKEIKKVKDSQELHQWASFMCIILENCDLDDSIHQSLDSTLFFEMILDLKTLNYYDTSIKILLFLMDHYSCKKYSVQFEDCEHLLRDLYKLTGKSMESETLRWRYEPLLDSWILATPALKTRNSLEFEPPAIPNNNLGLQSTPIAHALKRRLEDTPQDTLFSPDPIQGSFNSNHVHYVKESDTPIIKKSRHSGELQSLNVHNLLQEQDQDDSLYDGLSDLSDESDLVRENRFETIYPGNNENSNSQLSNDGLEGLISRHEDPILIISPLSKSKKPQLNQIFKTPLPKTFEKDDLA